MAINFGAITHTAKVTSERLMETKTNVVMSVAVTPKRRLVMSRVAKSLLPHVKKYSN